MALTFSEIKIESQRFGRTAYVASVSPSAMPYVSPVTFSWSGDHLLAFLASNETKVKNIRLNPKVSIHFAVSETTNWDSCIFWGDAKIIDTTDGREALWGEMGYDCNIFEPGGPSAGTHVFMVVEVSRGLILRNYGIGGKDSWHR